MASRPKAKTVKPCVVFDISTIVMDLDASGTFDAWTARAGAVVGGILLDAVTEVLSIVPTVPPRPTNYRLSETSGAYDLMYSLDQVRGWSTCVEDTAVLGALGRVIVSKLSAEVGERHRYAVFSQEILEGVCLLALRERVSLHLEDYCMHSEGFETWRDRGSRAEGLTADQVYLAWVDTSVGSYQFVVDCNGMIWREYSVNQETGDVEPLASARRTGRDQAHAGGRTCDVPERLTAEQVHPRMVFDINAIMYYEGDVGQRKAEELAERVVVEAYGELCGVASVPRLRPRWYHLGTAAEAPDLMFMLEQVRLWLGTVADLIALGAFAVLILKKLRDRWGEASRPVVFSREIVEGICLRSLRKRVGGDVDEISVRSESFDTFWAKGMEPESVRGTELYLVWVSVGEDRYQVLADCRGRIWAEYYVNRKEGAIESLGGEAVPGASDA